MKKIDTWLDIQRFLEGATRVPVLPRESEEFTQVGLSEIAEVRSVRRAFYTTQTI
ncbi:MAG: hypothetical protein ACYCZ0_02440 [Minisyncoccota bacterium]